MVFLLHFDQPFHHVRHFLTAADSIEAEPGHVAPLELIQASTTLEAAMKCGITARVARTWPGTQFTASRLRSLKNSSKLCPLCAVKGACESAF